MKIGGVPITPPEDEMIILQRGDKFLVFKFRALDGREEFEKLCPEPQVPGGFDAKGNWVPDEANADYKKQSALHYSKWMAYLVIASLAPSEIEWATVKLEDHRTWLGWDKDLRKAGITQPEINAIWSKAVDVNTLTEDRLEKARKAFQLGQAQASVNIYGPNTEPLNTPSGEPASASA